MHTDKIDTSEKQLLVEELLEYSEKFLYLDSRDKIYLRNRLLSELKLSAPLKDKKNLDYVGKMSVPDALIEKLSSIAVQDNLAAEGTEELFTTRIMGELSPLPSVVADTFYAVKEKEGIEKACSYLFNLSIMNNYVQKTAISRNLMWKFDDKEKNRYIEITINLSKPEKDNKQIAKLVSAPVSEKYPACMLCKENVGFEGSASHPARGNLRTVPLTLGGESWFVQYSPYGYFNEHMIAVSDNHTPMKIDGGTIDKLLDFVDFFPNYMVGSNAALPIVGGSILNHEHFQGGGHLMPMHGAGIAVRLECDGHKSVVAGIVDWYNSVIRLESDERSQIAAVGKKLVSAWDKYSDRSLCIIAQTDGVKHNSVTPIARKEGGKYLLDLIFRNNMTSEEYPDGIFHAHPEYHNIKKEGIGLIEAMGMFILPGRLKTQLAEIADILCGKKPYDFAALSDKENNLFVHRFMIKQLMDEGLSPDLGDAERRVRDKVNQTCRNILINTAVFKEDESGRAGFLKFLATAGLKIKK